MPDDPKTLPETPSQGTASPGVSPLPSGPSPYAPPVPNDPPALSGLATSLKETPSTPVVPPAESVPVATPPPVAAEPTPKKSTSNKSNKIGTIIGVLFLLLLIPVGAFFVANPENVTRYFQKASTGVTPIKIKLPAGGKIFTCTPEQAATKPACINFPGSRWESGMCVLNTCPFGDTNHDTACGLEDEGASISFGDCFTIDAQVSGSLECYQFDTIISNTDHRWCDLTSPPSICTGYEDNLNTCISQTPTPSLTSTPTNTPTNTLTSTPTNMPTNTPTATPVPREPGNCDASCGGDGDCRSGLVCATVEGVKRCRNPECPSVFTCNCPIVVTATPIPTTHVIVVTATPGPEMTPTPIPVPKTPVSGSFTIGGVTVGAGILLLLLGLLL